MISIPAILNGIISQNKFPDLPVRDSLSYYLSADYGVSVSPTFQVTAWRDRANEIDFIPDIVTSDIILVPSVASLNNKPAIFFGRSNNSGSVGLYNNLVNTTRTIFTVYILVSITGFEYSVLFEGNGLNIYTSYASGNRRFGSYVYSFRDANTISTLNIPYVRCATSQNGTTLNFFLNGVADGFINNANGFYPRNQTVIGNGGARFSRPSTGPNQPFQGYIAEIICYNRVLSSIEISATSTYLQSKYSIY